MLSMLPTDPRGMASHVSLFCTEMRLDCDTANIVALLQQGAKLIEGDVELLTGMFHIVFLVSDACVALLIPRLRPRERLERNTLRQPLSFNQPLAHPPSGVASLHHLMV